MRCRCEAQGNCAGSVKCYLGPENNKDTSVGAWLCKYHGELTAKLKTMTLAQLENLAKVSLPIKTVVDCARRVALCSTTQEWHRNAASVYSGKYDYTNH